MCATVNEKQLWIRRIKETIDNLNVARDATSTGRTIEEPYFWKKKF